MRTTALILICNLETLDSIVNQTYSPKNIELIISDDGSKDNTVQVIQSWLKKYKNPFYDVKFFANTQNGGISRNCNIAWKSSCSEWIKTIAGDDILSKECLSINMAYVRNNPNCKVIFSKMAHFMSDINKIHDVTPPSIVESFFKLSSKMQYEYLLRYSFNMAPTSFINTSVLKTVDYCDEQYKLIEDLPLWLKITKAGFSMSYCNSVTVFYRKGNSISQSVTRLTNVDFINQMLILHRNEVWPNFSGFSKWRILDTKIKYLSWLIPAKIFKNKRHLFSILTQRLIFIFRPSIFILIKNRIILMFKK
ncbi:glycosyltransferase family 2 protein [Providencia rettgeri]